MIGVQAVKKRVRKSKSLMDYSKSDLV